MGLSAYNSLLVAAIVLLAIVIIYVCYNRYQAARKQSKEQFVVTEEARQIYRQAQEVFQSYGDNVTYSQYKGEVLQADPVQYTKVRNLHLQGNLSPESVQVNMS